MKWSTLRDLFRIIKWCGKMVLVITGVVPLARCGSGYREEGGKVTFNGEEIRDKNFVVLNEVFGKDSAAAYYKRYAVPDADMATFTALDKHYAKDRERVYYCDEEREGQNYYLTRHSVIVKLQGAHPASFTILGEGYEGYARDRQRGYFRGTGFAVKDAASLSIIEGRFVKDRYQVYFNEVPVKGADPGSFRMLNDCYASDTDHIYYFGYPGDLNNRIREMPCKKDPFVILEYPYSKDSGAVFYHDTRISEADAATFTVVGNSFSRDQKHVYRGTKILAGADPATFRVLTLESSLDDMDYSKDGYHVFWKDRMFGVADVTAFRPLGLEYATDGKGVYYRTKAVKNADPATFKIYDHGYGDADAEDAGSKYLKGVNAGR